MKKKWFVVAKNAKGEDYNKFKELTPEEVKELSEDEIIEYSSAKLAESKKQLAELAKDVEGNK